MSFDYSIVVSMNTQKMICAANRVIHCGEWYYVWSLLMCISTLTTGVAISPNFREGPAGDIQLQRFQTWVCGISATPFSG